jgi:hypothetical protein
MQLVYDSFVITRASLLLEVQLNDWNQQIHELREFLNEQIFLMLMFSALLTA